MRITISLPEQSLALFDARGSCLARYPVSTARNGPGERRGSYCTPRGAHIVRARIGAGAARNAVFVGRRPSGEIWTPELAAQVPGRDWILTRILWLSGLRRGFNRLGEVDSMARYIYIHGAPDSAPMGQPESAGCVRMRSDDIIDLFARVPCFCRVDIDDFSVRTGPWHEMATHAAPLRTRVFVEEQGVPAALEMDDQDRDCLHGVAFSASGTVLGTGRLLPDGHIGRMAVRADMRGAGVGRALMHGLIAAAEARGLTDLRLNAQSHASDFYRPFGFVPEGEPFMEAGIAHCAMLRSASTAGSTR